MTVFQEVECRIVGNTASGQSIEIRESTRVPPGETQLVRLSIGELGAGSYRFEARGISPLSFIESTELQYKHKVSSALWKTRQTLPACSPESFSSNPDGSKGLS